MAALDAFNAGDYIEVRRLEKDRGTHRDWGVLRGTALSAMSRGGTAIFNLRPDPVIRTYEEDELTLRFNANDVDVRLLFAATVARSSY